MTCSVSCTYDHCESRCPGLLFRFCDWKLVLDFCHTTALCAIESVGAAILSWAVLLYWANLILVAEVTSNMNQAQWEAQQAAKAYGKRRRTGEAGPSHDGPWGGVEVVDIDVDGWEQYEQA